MKPYISLLVILLWGFVGRGAAQQTGAKFPALESEDLSGKAVSLPANLPGEPCLVLVAFDSGHQVDIDKWIEALELQDNEDFAWIELPVLDSKFKLLRSIIDGGMRSGITSDYQRARTITIYSSRADFMESLKITSVESIYAIVVQKDGKVLAQVEGAPDDAKSQTILDAMGKSAEN